jgi:hypothetical protein
MFHDFLAKSVIFSQNPTGARLHVPHPYDPTSNPSHIRGPCRHQAYAHLFWIFSLGMSSNLVLKVKWSPKVIDKEVSGISKPMSLGLLISCLSYPLGASSFLTHGLAVDIISFLVEIIKTFQWLLVCANRWKWPIEGQAFACP